MDLLKSIIHIKRRIEFICNTQNLVNTNYFKAVLCQIYRHIHTHTHRHTQHIYLITYLLTYSMVQSPSWEANRFEASQEIPRISRNLKVHYRTTSVRHLSLSWVSPIQSIYPHPTSWRSILILSTHLLLGLPSGLLPSGFASKTQYTPLSSPITHNTFNMIKFRYKLWFIITHY